MGPLLDPRYIAECIRWAHHTTQDALLNVLDGPINRPKIYWRKSCIGPFLDPRYTAESLIWAHHTAQDIARYS
jgi:hypothetical protein